MANTAIAATALTANTLSGRIDGTTPSAGMISVSTGNTGVIAASGSLRKGIIIISGDGTHTATVTFSAGDEPPSERSGIGASSGLSIAATGSYIVPLDAGRFVQDDGTVLAVVSGTGPVYIGYFTEPIGQ